MDIALRFSQYACLINLLLLVLSSLNCRLQAIFTLIIVGYILLASSACPKAYNYWAILALDILGVVFWISTTGLLAAWASGLLISSYTDSSSYDCSYDYYYCYKKRSLDPLLQKRYAVTTVDTWFNVLCASAGIAGLGL